MIYFNYEDVSEIDLDTALLSNWISAVIKKFGKIEGEIVYVFSSDEYILKINNEFLNHNYYTDIITFDYCNNKIVSGDIIISLETVLSNSKEYNTTFEIELNRVIIHGILHLLGFKDKTEKENENMHQLEDDALNILKTIS